MITFKQLIQHITLPSSSFLKYYCTTCHIVLFFVTGMHTCFQKELVTIIILTSNVNFTRFVNVPNL